jgi:NAD(P)-dependent dehydrogenase (short-subunit alcohol dehydrogenase family)
VDVRDLHGRFALVTGAGSGIGRASALAFARRGADLALCDVDEAGLAATSEAARGLGREVLAQRVDVARADEMGAFADAVHRRVPAVDVLMNNAGIAIAGGFLDTSLADWERIRGVNELGVIHGCHYFVPPMVRAGGPRHVVNVASMAAYIPSEALSAYTMTKYAVLGLSEALWLALRAHGIGVTAVCPGIIDTAIVRNAAYRGRIAGSDAARRRMAEVFARRGYPPERVAEGVLRAIQRNRAIAPITPEAFCLYHLKRLAPGFVRWLLAFAERQNRRQFEKLVG